MSVEQVKPFGIEFLEEVKAIETHGSANRTFVPTVRDITRLKNGQIMFEDPDEVRD